MTRGSQRGRRCGFTLVEVVLGLAITTVLLGAMGSLIFMASRVIPDRVRTTDQSLSCAAVLDLMNADLSQTLAVTDGTPTSVTFTVADRDGNGTPETIVYAWAGAGTALTRSVNGGLAQKLINPVNDFALGYMTTTSTTTGASSVSTIGETLVSNWPTGGLGLLGSLTLGAASLDSGKYIAQNIRPTLPAGARSWTITRVQICGKSDLLAAGGTIAVQLRTTDSTGMPTSTVLATGNIAESAFGPLAFGSAEVTFANAPPLAPNQEVAIVLVCGAGCPAGVSGYGSVATARSAPMWINNGSATTGSTLQVMPHAVYATATGAAQVSAMTNKLGQITVRLRAGTATSPEARSTINLLNTPGVW